MKFVSLIVLTLTIFAVSAVAQSGPRTLSFVASASIGDVPNDGSVRSRTVESEPRLSPTELAERAVFTFMNSERASRGLLPLEWSDEIAAVARMHSRNMADNNFFSHQGLDGLLVDERADRSGLSGWTAIGENIAFMRGIPDPAKTVVEKWLQSASHRDNLLAARWKQSAIGVAITADGTIYFTQVFMTR
ncbi:MAG: CAP domain-containing protein [Acidobacteriota bacterium]